MNKLLTVITNTLFFIATLITITISLIFAKVAFDPSNIKYELLRDMGKVARVNYITQVNNVLSNMSIANSIMLVIIIITTSILMFCMVYSYAKSRKVLIYK